MTVSKVPSSAKKKPRGGSRKGKPNKVTANIKEMIEGALSAVGGQAYLQQQAIENPTAFMTLVGKILPKDVNVGGQPDNPVQINTTVESAKGWLSEIISGINGTTEK